ncbi:N-acetylglucosamine-6-phosphate deacetylase [Pseudactinotalea sp. Z1739]|uniref:N-acetylglucosamine-6-phosphate deacetylase n=1 Tax=Pseudactinotalea sp. Z1739 TaxID=3413028 RepID=UPI003C7A77C0
MDRSHRTPGLIDLQVNGYGGYDVNADDVTPETVAALTRSLWEQGVTTYLPTVITASEDKIAHSLAQIAGARRSDPLIAHSIPGVHVEGPSLAADDGPRGAHDAAQLRNPDLGELDRWQTAAEGLVRIVTLAPERPGTVEYIKGAVRRGVRISIGHCAPEQEHICDAVEAGATLSTHLGNGTYPVLPRHPNHIWAQLAQDRLSAMFIPDGHHLPADTLTAMIRAKSVARTVFTSDSAALAGMPAGQYETPVGGSVTVGDDGRLTLTGTNLLAGSGHSLRAGLNWAQQNLPFSHDELSAMVTTNPAALLGLSKRVTGGADTVDLVGTKVIATRVAGIEVHRA